MIFFSLPGNEGLTESLAEKCMAERGSVTMRHFPDGETYVKVNSDIAGMHINIVCTLNQPDDKLLPLYFLAKTLKSLGAKSICLVAPYLAYMRQDKRFQPGEGVTSEYFATLLSSFVDSIITIDPHLHRRNSLNEIYTIPSTILHAAPLISKWIKENLDNPVLVGPDSESEQWISETAKNSETPFIILNKERKGDNDVHISTPVIENYMNHTPVLIDDIISTGTTMIETIQSLKRLGMKSPVCIGVHGIFAGNAYNNIVNAAADKIITTNTVAHQSNAIDISELIITALTKKYHIT